jgi:hypothetical protein
MRLLLAENWRPRMAASEISNPNVVGPSVGLLWRDLKVRYGSHTGVGWLISTDRYATHIRISQQ